MSRCGGTLADHLHMFWRPQTWNKIILIINRAFQVSLNNDPLTCTLGFLNEELLTPHAQTAISCLLYVAPKWIAPPPPRFEEWHTQVNSILLKERYILNFGGTPSKFNKQWNPWLQVPGLAPIALNSLQLLQGL